jgi:hypothetical protein
MLANKCDDVINGSLYMIRIGTWGEVSPCYDCLGP